MPGQSVSTFAKLGLAGTKICFRQILDDTVYTKVDDSADTMCGSLDHDSRMVTDGIKIVRFRVIMRPSPQEMSVLLPIMGFTAAGSNYSLVPNFASSKFTSVIDRVAKVSTYTNCMVSKWILSGARGFRSMQLELHIVAEDVSHGAAGSFALSAPATRTAGYPLNKGVLSLAGTQYRFNRFALAVDMMPSVEWNNAVTAGAIEATDRLIAFTVSTPYTSDEIALIDNAVVADYGGLAGSLQFSRTGESTLFSMPALHVPVKLPNVPQRAEIRSPQTYLAYIHSDGSAPLSITHSASA